MATKIQFTFNAGSVRKAMDDIDKYIQHVTLANQKLVEKLSEDAFEMAYLKWLGIMDENYQDGCEVTGIQYDGEGADYSGTITLEGEQAVFVEYGAGMYYNGGDAGVGDSPHPKGKERGYTIGGYGKGGGAFEKFKAPWAPGWTHGVGAYMPIYSGWLRAKNQVEVRAKEAFGNGE